MKRNERGKARPFHDDDGGFSTLGMVLALLVTLSLVFSAAQVYRIHSLSADVQNVADASALAAENQVASFYVAAQVCDAAVLTMSLTGIAVAGVGAVCLCVPPAAPVGEKLIAAAGRILKARNDFSRSAAQGLNRLQKLLPFIAAAQAFGVAAANGGTHASYVAVAVLLPNEGEQIEGAAVESDEVVQGIEEKRDGIERAGELAEEAAKRAAEHKERAWKADCGAVPGYCMAERAEKLAGLSGSRNPTYRSVDAWSFQVALARAQAYYPLRRNLEAPASSTVAEQARSALRKRFYTYASTQVARGYVHETEDSFDAYFPLLPKNTAEMRTTSLYTEAVYPVTVDEEAGTRTMHAWSGCPKAAGATERGSVAQLDAGGYTTCPTCGFKPSSLGAVAAASSSIQNGFEYHYRIVAEEAAAYEKARDEQEEAARGAKNPLQEVFADLAELARDAVEARIEVAPPGRDGAIAVAACLQAVPVASLMPNGFVASTGSLGARVAVSAAKLEEDSPEEGRDLVTSLADGLIADSSGIAGQGLQLVLDVWAGMLRAHTQGSEAFAGAVESALNGLPLVGKSGLGTWAAKKLKGALKDFGLEPADVTARKPVLANTYHVASADAGALGSAYVSAKNVGAHVPASAVNPVGGVIGTAVSFAVERIEGFDSKIEVARIQILGEGGPSVPITVTLPPAVTQGAVGLVERAGDALSSIAGGGDDDIWR